MALQRLARRSIVDETTDALLAQILHGHWAPGTKVPTEASLTADLGVSRSTVREALNRLASAGLLHIPHGGSKIVQDPRIHGGLDLLASMVVSPEGVLDLTVVRDVAEMRGALAPDVARRAAQRGDGRHLLALAEALDPQAELGTLMEDTVAWWGELVAQCDNVAYRLAFNTLLGTYTEGRAVLQQVLADELRAADTYVAIARAVVDGDPAAAATRTQELVALGNASLFLAIDAHGG